MKFVQKNQRPDSGYPGYLSGTIPLGIRLSVTQLSQIGRRTQDVSFRAQMGEIGVTDFFCTNLGYPWGYFQLDSGWILLVSENKCLCVAHLEG